MDQWRNVSAHVQPLASGRLVAPGDTSGLDPDDPHDAALIEDGAFAKVDTKKNPTPKGE
jgi:hypothetical protein